MDVLEELRDDLWTRWRQAFDRLGEVNAAAGAGRRVVYANNSLFDLRSYSPLNFSPGGRVLQEMPEGVTSYNMYRLDDSGLPVHMAARHIFNKIDWQGVYKYSDSEAEYIEFCLQTKVVSEYIRIALRNGIPATMQRLKVNGGGSHLAGHTGKNGIDFIASSPYNYFAEVEEYESSTGRITSGRTLAEGMGTPEIRSTLAYFYSDSGELQRVIRAHETGRNTTVYAAPTETATDDLAAQLSEKIAVRAIDALTKQEFGSPLLTVELSYRPVTNYVPHLIAVTEKGFLAKPAFAGHTNNKNWVDLNDEDFEPEMTEFTERLNTAEEWDPGTTMVRNAALLITQRLPRSVPSVDSFVAFAIDWEFEGHDLETILKDCGATSETLKKLRSIGWLD